MMLGLYLNIYLNVNTQHLTHKLCVPVENPNFKGVVQGSTIAPHV